MNIALWDPRQSVVKIQIAMQMISILAFTGKTGLVSVCRRK